MKKIIRILGLAVFGLVMTAGVASAGLMKVALLNKMPDRYALIKITGADPAKPLDRSEIRRVVQAELAKSGVQGLDFVVYDQGKKEGDGIRAAGSIRYGMDLNIEDFYEEFAGEKGLRGKFEENLVGYMTSPNRLCPDYDNNEVVADELFKGMPVILLLDSPRVSKDPQGKPFVHMPITECGLSGVKMYIAEDDPFLRRINKYAKIALKGRIKGVSDGVVLFEGLVVRDKEYGRVGDKLFPIGKLTGSTYW